MLQREQLSFSSTSSVSWQQRRGRPRPVRCLGGEKRKEGKITNLVRTLRARFSFLDFWNRIWEIKGRIDSFVAVLPHGFFLAMAEDLGLKAVSRVEEADRFPFLKALAHLAAVDDSIDLDERRMVEQYAEAWELDASAKSQVQDILETKSSLSIRRLASEFSESGTRFLLIQELMRLGYADGTYDEEERKEIAGIAQRMGMSEDQFREVEKWVGRGQAWGTGGEDEPGEEDLQQVLDEEEDEGDDDHDLSDIETGDVGLSEIDSNLSEVDPSEFEGEEDEGEE